MTEASAAEWRRARDGVAAAVASELEELDDAPDLASAQALLARLAALRSASLSSVAATGGVEIAGWLLFRPGRSALTGEAEIASRGFFDVADRPPPVLWLEAVARRRAPGSEVQEVAILVPVPADCFEEAAAGREACPSGAITWVAEASASLARQVEAMR